MSDFREDTKIGMGGETIDEAKQAVDGDPILGTVVGSRYRIARLLGKGNMARVYVAEQLSMKRNVAVKVLQPDLLVDSVAEKRFRQEVDAVSRLHSPHTIRFYDAGRTPDSMPYVVMELLFGESLRERMDRAELHNSWEVISIVRQIAASLEEAHAEGILHRDLKPENVYLCHLHSPMRPFVKLLDFGLAKLIDDLESGENLTAAKTTVGTPAYMAPEMIVETRPVDYRCDIYALGLIAFELLTGSRPYNEKNAMEMAIAHVKAEIPSARARNPELPESIDGFFEFAIAKKADDRPQSARELAESLAAVLGVP